MGQVNFTDVFIIFIFLGALGGGALLVNFFLYRSIAEHKKGKGRNAMAFGHRDGGQIRG